MKIRLEQSQFADIVGWVLRSVSSRSTLPALGGILFRATGSTLSLTGTDQDVSGQLEVEVAIDEPGSVLLPGRLLGDIAKSLTGGAVRIETDGTQATISCGSTQFTLRTLPVDDFPSFETPTGSAGSVAFSDFTSAVGQVARASSNDEVRPVLTGILVDIEGEVATLVATDSYRLAVRTLPWTGLSEPVRKVIPARSFSEAARMAPEGELTITLADTKAAFTSGSRTLVSRLIDGEFPNWKNLIPADLPNRLTVGKDTFIEAVRRVGLLASAGAPVRITLTESAVTLTAGSQDLGEATEQIEAKYEGEELTVAFNPGYLVDGVAAVQGSEVVLLVRDGLKPAVLRAPDDESFTYLVMPVRL
jgi:DNA polymerase III subunit beta